jgi:hypothetical protein
MVLRGPLGFLGALPGLPLIDLLEPTLVVCGATCISSVGDRTPNLTPQKASILNPQPRLLQFGPFRMPRQSLLRLVTAIAHAKCSLPPAEIVTSVDDRRQILSFNTDRTLTSDGYKVTVFVENHGNGKSAMSLTADSRSTNERTNLGSVGRQMNKFFKSIDQNLAH